MALFEMGSRSPFERWIEQAIYRIGIVLARARLLPGIPDISVGPFQIRPSTAFGWERRRIPFGHLAVPVGDVDAESLTQAASLLETMTAIDQLVKVLTAVMGEGATCETLADVYSRYRGRRLAPSEIDHEVLMGVHDAIHATKTRG